MVDGVRGTSGVPAPSAAGLGHKSGCGSAATRLRLMAAVSAKVFALDTHLAARRLAEVHYYLISIAQPVLYGAYAYYKNENVCLIQTFQSLVLCGSGPPALFISALDYKWDYLLAFLPIYY